jgi:2-polyprenyl-3-methyl-5-hydroxy-6-metoxy-1,4-benzoquinol methylase
VAEFVEVPCPACFGERSELAFEKQSFAYRSCVDCRTLFMSPRPSPEVMAAYYAQSENYRYWADHIFPASEAARREKIHRPWLERVVDYCGRAGVPRGLLVEVGPGFGTFAELARERFDRVQAVEPTPELAEACRRRGVAVVERRFESVGDEIAPPDVLVAFEVIEHLFDPGGFVRQCARLLPAGRLLVLSCPNGLGFDVAQLGAESLAVDPEHVNLFNPVSLRRLVGSCGFEVMEASTPGRLDAEFVRTAVLEGRHDLSGQPFLRRVLIDEWERLGPAFQQFLAEHGLSSHMWLAAQRCGDR